MTNCIAGIQYLPSVEYFAHWMHHSNIVFEIHEHYQKRTWRNKTLILGTQKPLPLTVPLRKGKNHELPITKVEIAYDEIWTKVHMNSIRTAYGKTAFFNELEDDLVSIFNSTPKYLWELNLQFIQMIISYFPGEWNIEYTHSYESSLADSISDLRKGVPAGHSSLMKSSYPMYEQIHHFNISHLPNLSILDVLCHLGPGSYDYLKHYASELYR